ncbi:hypothetical protein KM043_012377 [Ampulex compressa]|nr:hypothetical protein KM043_012377 [Ampulex compressa]
MPPTTRLHGPRAEESQEKACKEGAQNLRNCGFVSQENNVCAIAEATGKIGLDKDGLEDGILTVRNVIVIEVPGQKSANKADKLARLMREVRCKDVRIDRPIKMADLRVRGFFREAAVDAKTVVVAIAAKAKCGEEVIQAGDIRQGPREQGSMWICLSLVSAWQAAAGGKFRLLWMKVDGNGDGAALPLRQLRVYLKRMDASVIPIPLRENEADNPSDTGEPAM